MAYYLIWDLRDSRMHITVIDSSAARCQEMSEKMPGVLVIHGDAADSELLNEEGPGRYGRLCGADRPG